MLHVLIPLLLACCRQLPYLEAVVLETLRLRPPAYIVGRCAAEGDDLAGFHIQPGQCSAAPQPFNCIVNLVCKHPVMLVSM